LRTVRHLERVDRLNIGTKQRNDFVSEVDRLAEAEIIRLIHRAYPEHAVLAEESGRQGESEFEWVVDPLDGTTNFLHGFPQFAVSIALKHRGRLDQAVVYDPLRQELFTASRGAGATLNDRRIRVTRANGLDGALLGTGFPFRQQQHLDAYLAMFRALFPDAAGIRRAGAAALDLAYVAAGRLDGFWEIGLNEWDTAAGALLVLEAGGMVSDFDGGGDYLETGNVICAGPRLHGTMVAAIRPHRGDALRR
jgi:myo-inositol-1(or 4)-monophosphatase